MVYILNALPLVGEGVLVVLKSSLRKLQEAYEKGAVSLIGHESTARLLGVEYNRGQLKTFEVGDVYYVARLKVRLPESGDLPTVTEDDIVVYKVKVLESPVIEWPELARRAEEAAKIAEADSTPWTGAAVFDKVLRG